MSSASNGTVKSLPEHVRFAIVGSGFAGIGCGIRLKQEGENDFLILERAGDVGGTWRDNTYPGCACDVPSHLYSFSFEPNPNWSRTFSPQPEIWDYLRHCTKKYGIEPHIRFNHMVTEAAWDDEAEVWRVETEQGSLTADFLIAGVGPLSDPRLPDIPGIESFEGRMFHTARWDHDYDLRGKRVAVIGTGASSIQVVPKIQPLVGKLHVFQRTAPWIVPQRDRELTRLEKRLYKLFPPAQLAMRAAIYWMRELFVIGFMHPREGGVNEKLARTHLQRQVKDPELRAKLTPNYRMGCKRVLISDSYYPALQQPNAEVVTDRITEIRPHSIVTADGEEREVDAIVLGTGFHVTDMPVAEYVKGRGGRTMADMWQGSPQAYLGSTVAGFPNLFFLVGPNTGLGHNSIVFMIESQLNYLAECLEHMKVRDADVFEVRDDVQERFNARIQKQLEGTVWNSGGCASWYIDENGKNTTIWPGFTWPYRQQTRHFNPADYALTARRRAPQPVAA
ncbi:MAG TPA: NAD(P)/FAD-dependent oxidoreductase [Thermoleophilaceae bacterium]